MIIKATKEEYRALMAKKLVDFADSYRACLRSRRVNALTGERIISKLRYQIRYANHCPSSNITYNEATFD